MKKITPFFLFLLTISIASAQTDKAKQLINEGIALYDQDNYTAALEKYNESYKLDSNNVALFSEMAMTYLEMKNYDKAESLCKQAIIKFKDDQLLTHIYDTYGNSFDDKGKPEEALKIYDEGISKFPGYSLLYFNKGVTEYGLKRNYAARADFQKAITLNPSHASSYFYLGIIEEDFGNRIPTILAFSKFMILSPDGGRARQVLPHLIKMTNNLYYQQKNGNTIATYSSAEKRADTAASTFSEVESGLSMISIMATVLPDEHQTALEKFETQEQTIFELLAANKKKYSGFYWDTMAPYFIDIELKKQVPGFVYYINSIENKDKDVQKTLKENQKKIDHFVEWNKSVE